MVGIRALARASVLGPRSFRGEAGDRRYVAAAMQMPLLDREREQALARRWRDEHDEAALHELVEAFGRLVVRIAGRFRGYGLPVGDLLQEGNVGLLEAVARYDPAREIRFSTYATWRIMASIQAYVLRNVSVVRMATTRNRKRLFFRLRRTRLSLGIVPDRPLADADCRRIAKELGVTADDVALMDACMAAPDLSLNERVGPDGSVTMEDTIADGGPSPETVVGDRHDLRVRSRWLDSAFITLTPRERQIIASRFWSDDRPTLADLAVRFGVTRERMRQIEGRALAKLRANLEARGIAAA
jgi:RNA polymerase sigma-32 factor